MKKSWTSSSNTPMRRQSRICHQINNGNQWIVQNSTHGLLLIIGRFRESRESKKDLWKVNEGLSRHFYAAIMSHNRFADILRYIRFDDSATREERKVKDKLAPLREVRNIFSQNCKDCYDATEVGCVDEQLVTFHGRCSFKYMPSKPGKYGIKIWTLCDSKTYYCCNIDIYRYIHNAEAPRKSNKDNALSNS